MRPGEKLNVAILGMGVVGRAQERMFGCRDHNVVTYDPKDDRAYPGEISKADFAVICVGTPAREGSNGEADLTGVHAAIDGLPVSMPVLLRSTVPPGTTEQIAAGHEAPVVHCPEFMYERPGGQWHSSMAVPWMLLGGDPEARQFFRQPLERVFPGTIWECRATVAELAKYTANLYWATRVTFVNEMAAIASAFGEDWADVRDAWLCDKRVSPAYTAMEGFPPGFGGRCWPKDLDAMIAAAEKAGYFPGFLCSVDEENQRFSVCEEC